MVHAVDPPVERMSPQSGPGVSMRYQGKIVSWDDQRGFGFVIRHGDDVKVFVHVSSFPAGSKRPAPGDVVTYRLVPDGRGRSKAVDAEYPGARIGGSAALSPGRARTPRGARTSNPLRLLPALTIVVGLAWYWLGSAHRFDDVLPSSRSKASAAPVATEVVAPTFRCEAGKTHCSHMRSYAEALYYVRNCPNVSMDGDGDGEPCESQFGGGFR